MVLVELEQVKFDRDLYPRFEADNTVVNQYRTSVDSLPPIVITQDYVLIDGYHRLLAYRLEKVEKIEVEIIQVADRLEALKESIRRNSTHGKQLSLKEKKDNARRLYKLGSNLDDIKSLLSITKRTAQNYTADLRADEKEKRKEEILELYLQCHTFEEIRDKLEVSLGTISNVFKNGKFSENEIPTNLQYYNVWNIHSLGEKQLKYPGQTPLDLVENVIYYFTEPPQTDPLKISLVVDPMAGSGIVRDACRNLMRRYRLYDKHPIREDIPIKQNDILEGLPEEVSNVDLFYLDPPYYKLVTDYKDNPFMSSYDSFLKSMNRVFEVCKPRLSKNGKIALELKPMNEEMTSGEWYDMSIDSVIEAQKQGYKLYKRISAPLTAAQFNANQMEKAKKTKTMLNLLRDVIILEKNNGKI